MLYDPNWKPAETEIKLEPWQEILLKAADLIEKEGWAKGALDNGDGYCIVGAMQKTAFGEVHSSQHRDDGTPDTVLEFRHRKLKDYRIAFKKVAASCRYSSSRDPVVWNDSLGSKAKVLTKLRRVARGA